MNFFAPTPTSADPLLAAFLPLAGGPIAPNGAPLSGTAMPIVDFSSLLGECSPRPAEASSAGDGALLPVREHGATPEAPGGKAEAAADLVVALLAAGYQPAFAAPAPEMVPSAVTTAEAFAPERSSEPNVANERVAGREAERRSPVPSADVSPFRSPEARSSQLPAPVTGRTDIHARVSAEDAVPLAGTIPHPERPVNGASFDSRSAKVVAPHASVVLPSEGANFLAPESVEAPWNVEAGSGPLFSSQATTPSPERGRGAALQAYSPESSIPPAEAAPQSNFGREGSRPPNLTAGMRDIPAVATTAAVTTPGVTTAAGISAVPLSPRVVEPNATRRLTEVRATAKIAATPVGRVQVGASAVGVEIKSFLAGRDEQLASHVADVGTTVAKTPLVMPTAEIKPLAVRPDAYPVADYAVSSLDVPGEMSATSQVGDIDHAQAAHRAVEALLSAVDQTSDRTQQSVTLHFSVGDEQLKVRVERQADEVRAVFATDSDELRAALAQEWHAAGAERQVRGATPVFTTADGGASSFGDSTPRQQQHLPQQNQNNVPAFPRFSAREPDRPATSEPAHGPTISPVHSRHLHTHA